MKKYLFLSLAFVCLVTSSGARLYTTTEDIKVRSDKRSHSAALGVLKTGTQIDVEDDNGTWGKVKFDDEDGYIKTKYLKPVIAPPPAAEDATNSLSGQNVTLFSILAILALAVASKLLYDSRRRAGKTKSKAGHREKHSLRLFWYQCKHCKAVVKNGVYPSHAGCLKSKLHHWTELAEVGIDNYFCKRCLTTIKANDMPAIAGCPGGENHFWVRR